MRHCSLCGARVYLVNGRLAVHFPGIDRALPPHFLAHKKQAIDRRLMLCSGSETLDYMESIGEVSSR